MNDEPHYIPIGTYWMETQDDKVLRCGEVKQNEGTMTEKRKEWIAEKRRSILDELSKLLENAIKEKREFTKEEETRYQYLNNRLDKVTRIWSIAQRELRKELSNRQKTAINILNHLRYSEYIRYPAIDDEEYSLLMSFITCQQ